MMLAQGAPLRLNEKWQAANDLYHNNSAHNIQRLFGSEFVLPEAAVIGRSASDKDVLN